MLVGCLFYLPKKLFLPAFACAGIPRLSSRSADFGELSQWNMVRCFERLRGFSTTHVCFGGAEYAANMVTFIVDGDIFLFTTMMLEEVTGRALHC